MPLAPGIRLGPYEVAARIGAGGMGEVWRATDLNLKRAVAIKVLPDSLVIDVERLARFRREAEVLASLNHPGIAAVYGVETTDGIRALVMEFVDGLTLADRVAQGKIPVDEALPVAKQIADALEAAHDQGIVHRDLKPANIKVRADGTVKVLDFGLAKAMEPTGAAASGVSMSPTITTPAMTQAGIILGTAAYMSPEQAKGKTADRRSDVWAFGCVLFELLAGRRAFAGEDISDTLAAVLRADPDWSALPNDVPIPIRRLLRRCLQKDRRERLADIADARLEIQDALRESRGEIACDTTTARAPRRHGVLALALAGTALVAAGSVAWIMRSGSADPGDLVQLQLFPPGDITIAPATVPEISPDGRAIAFAGFGGDGIARVYVRALDSTEIRALPGSERVRNTLTPFWSPDSREVAFDVGTTLKRVAVAGGPPQNVCDLPPGLPVIGGSWSQDGVMIVGTYLGLMRGRASGGACEPLTRASPSDGNHLFPVFLPDGRHVLYIRNGPGELVLGSVDAAPGSASTSVLKIRQGARYVPAPGSRVGRLLFIRDSTLFAQSFDPERLELAGDAVPLAGNIGTSYANAHFSASANGRLAYRTADSSSVQLTWFDRQGRAVAEVGEPVFPSALSVSPDGRRAAFGSLIPPYGLMAMDVPRGTSYKLADANTDTGVAWSADAERIVVAGRGGLYQRVLNGASGQQRLLLPSEARAPVFVWDWSRDGRFILYTTIDAEPGRRQMWALPLEADRKPLPLGTTGSEGRFSPDGRWFAYVSDESGRNEIYVRPFDPASISGSSEAGTPYTIISRGNVTAMLGWKDDGRELWYVTPDSIVMSVALRLDRKVDAGEPISLFQLPPGVKVGQPGMRVLSTDGERFLLGLPTRRSTQVPFTVVLNWPALMRN
jgi:serine/threonine protein kinase/Tol biopolymer transport system component